MDFVAASLGLNLPSLKARGSLLRLESGCPSTSVATTKKSKSTEWEDSSCDDRDTWDVPPAKSKLEDDEDDDATASTASFSEDDDTLTPCVTFAAPLVTQVHLRPFTTASEKSVLFYHASDFKEFRREYRLSLLRKRIRCVQFVDQVQVHTIPAVDNVDDIYYSAAELKQFLEQFIYSLDDQQQSCTATPQL